VNPTRFFVLGGVVLIISGTLQMLVRPRKPNENRFVNRGTIWAVVCMLFGVGAILVGSGYVPLH